MKFAFFYFYSFVSLSILKEVEIKIYINIKIRIFRVEEKKNGFLRIVRISVDSVGWISQPWRTTRKFTHTHRHTQVLGSYSLFLGFFCYTLEIERALNFSFASFEIPFYDIFTFFSETIDENREGKKKKRPISGILGRAMSIFKL